jgi:hypothetical protein
VGFIFFLVPIVLLPHHFKDLLPRSQKKQRGFVPSVYEGKEHSLLLARENSSDYKNKEIKIKVLHAGL